MALHLINGEHFAGAERVQDNLALFLPFSNYQVEFVALKDGAFLKERHSDVPVHFLPMASRWDIMAAFKVARIARERQATLIHSHTPRSILLGALAAKLTGLPLIHHLHSPTSRDTGQRWRDRRNAMIEWLGMRSAQAVIAVSLSLKAYANRLWLRSGAVSEIPNGVDVPDHTAGWIPPVGQQPWVLGFAALIRPRKGLEVVLDAVAVLRASGRQVTLLVVGRFETVDYEKTILARIFSMGLSDIVTLAGFQKDLSPYYQKMDLFLVPSLYGEGMPMVALEAMAQGLPVIASSVDGLPEVLDYGQAGLLVEAGNATALVESITKIMDHPMQGVALSGLAYQRCRDIYSAKAMAQNVARIYDGVLG